MSIQITVLLFVTTALLAASLINANSTRADYETTNDDYYSGNATTPGYTTVNSMRNGTIYSANRTLYYSTGNYSEKNGTNYFDSTTLSTPTANSSTINGTFVPKKNQTYTPSYYYTLTRNISTINGTFGPNRNQTYTPSYYYILTRHLSEKNEADYFNSTSLSTPTANSSMMNGTIASKKNGTLPLYYYNSSTTLQTPAGNFPTINGTFVPKRNQTYTPSYYNTSTTSQTPTGNFSFAESATTAQPQSNSSTYPVGDYKTDDDEYNKKKAIMEKRVDFLLERNQFSKFMNNPDDYNNTSNDTKDEFEPAITRRNRINYGEQVTTTATPDFSDNQMLNETVNLTQQQYPNKFQVLFDLWLLDSGNGDRMGKFDWNNLSMSEIPEIIYDNSTLIQKKQTILNTFNVLSKFIEQYVSTDRPGSGSLLRFFNGSTTMQDLVMIANVKDFVQLNGTTDETNSDQKEMGKHGQKVFRKTYTYTEEETIFSNP